MLCLEARASKRSPSVGEVEYQQGESEEQKEETGSLIREYLESLTEFFDKALK